MKMLYKRRGGPILNWDSGYPPHEYRAAETRGLGETPYVPDYILPGQPEQIGSLELPDFTSIETMAGTAIGAYHGYKRTGSIMWTLGWAALGGLFPLITGAVAVAQGFAKPKIKTNPAGLSKKGERMYRKIKRRYQRKGEPRAKEIAARTVYARAKTTPGLKK